MAVYQIEELYRDVSSRTVAGGDPMKAAEMVAGRKVSPRALQDHWFRVVDENEAAVGGV